MLYPSFIDKDIETIFDEWVGKDMGAWHKFTCDSHELEFYATTYKIKEIKPNNVVELPIPVTINDFINDCYRMGVDLIWSDFVDINYEPHEYLNQKQIIEYYSDLLNKMEKLNELII